MTIRKLRKSLRRDSAKHAMPPDHPEEHVITASSDPEDSVKPESLPPDHPEED